MPEYLAPGVYVEEVDTGSKPIEGVSTSTAGMVGVTERGPVDIPILVTSFGEFTRWFGGFLNQLDFSAKTDAFNFLPHAVQGFFTNQGKRLYVTRVINSEAALKASAFLFDRATPTTKSTLLLHAAGEATGSVAFPPPLEVLDVTPISAVNTWFRVGDGSTADYLQTDVAAIPDKTLVPLQFALSRSHAKKVGAVDTTLVPFTSAPAAGYGTINLVTPTALGETALLLHPATAPGLTKLLGATDLLVEIQGEPGVPGEHRIATKISAAPGGKVAVTLDIGLASSYTSDAVVVPIDPPPLPVATDKLGRDASASDAVVFLTSLAGLPAGTNLVAVNQGKTDQEVRGIGTLFELPVKPGAYEEYRAASTLVKVTPANDDTKLTLATTTVGQTEISIDDISGLAVGMKIAIDTGAKLETVTVVDFHPSTGNVTVTPMTQTHASAVSVTLPGGSLTASAAPGATRIALDSRLGISVGDVLLLDSGVSAEYVTVDAFPASGGTPPDPGNVLITAPLALAHATGATLRRQNKPALGSAPPSSVLLTAEAGTTSLLAGSGIGLASGDLIRVTTTTGAVYYHHINSAPTAPASVGTVNALHPLLHSHAAGSVVIPTKPLIDIEAIDLGAWGDRIQIAVEDEPAGLASGTTLSSIINPTHVKLASAAGVEAGTILEFTDPLNGDAVVDVPVKVERLDRTTMTVILAAPGLSAAQSSASAAAAAVKKNLGVRSREFRITLWLLRQPDPALPSRNAIALDSESFRYLSMDSRHSRYFVTIIGDKNGPLRLSDNRPDGQSRYIRVSDQAATDAVKQSVRMGPETLIDVLPTGQVRPARRSLDGGDDAVLALSDKTYIGDDAADPKARTGLFSLMNVEEISIISAPGRTSVTMQNALISQCETMRYRFAVLDGPPPPHDAMADVMVQRQQFDTKYAALYYPWLLIDDPFPKNLSNISPFAIPPAGHVVGIYARVDNQRGVHKAPGNEVVSGINGLQRTLYKAQQDILNPYPVNINVIRDFRTNDRGIVVYGARVITSDSDWKYVNVRRLLIFIEASIDRGMQWAVFEPNDEPLWARVRRSISNFLTLVWRNGALQGSKPEEAFFVKCDFTTMTQTDIDEGRLIVVIGVAPVKPAEFVIIRIGLWSPQSGG